MGLIYMQARRKDKNMAQKRMFDKSITNSDDFIDMPDSAQNLYFHLSMNADDDGFINNWKNIMRMTGHKEDDIKILIAKQYVIPFDSGVIVIKHWRINNYLRGDRYVETKFKAEKQQLQVDTNMVYQLDTNGIPTGIPSIDKSSIDKNSKEENSIEEGCREEKNCNRFVEIYTTYCTRLPQIRTLTDKRKKSITTFKKTYTLADWEEVCKAANASDFLTGNINKDWHADFDFLINVNNATKVLEGKYYSKKKTTTFADLERELLNDENRDTNDIENSSSVIFEVLPE